jgi:HEAT repeat protein
LAKFDKSDPGWKVRVEGLVGLLKSGPSVLPVLVDALKKGSPTTRAFAAQALAAFAEPDMRPALLKALEDPEPEVRIYAVQGLSLLGRMKPDDERYRRLLKKDPHPLVRVAVAWAFVRDDAGTAAKAIRKALREYNLADTDTARLDEAAPDFSLTDASGKTHRLGDFRGKRPVVLKFYFAPL